MLRQADAAAGLPVAEAAEAEEGDEEDEGTGTAEVDARRGGYWKAAAGSPGATSSDRGSCSGSGKSSGRYIGVCLISSKSCCRSFEAHGADLCAAVEFRSEGRDGGGREQGGEIKFEEKESAGEWEMREVLVAFP
eukprot:Mycagemm_TRINITY_DN10115_c0_g2::TRINITY_DN10115_c0_g2_i3::g.5292::m.5292 type:complete len:135 gc:universal TRINITY_DN10115_c0_g2_i3:421-17(-)